MVCLSRAYHSKFFKGCLPQILFGPFLNTLTHIIYDSGCLIKSLMLLNLQSEHASTFFAEEKEKHYNGKISTYK